MNKKLKILVPLVILAGVAAGLALPVSNLVVGLPVNRSLASIEATDPLFTHARDIMGQKCANCHTSDYVLPFYAKFPVAQDIIEKDIKLGLEFLDMPAALAHKETPAVSEVDLAKIEYTVDHKTMPPLRYLALHWNGGLTAKEADAVREWVKKTRAATYAEASLPQELKEHVIHPVPKSHNEDPAKVAIGGKMYNEKRLSKDDSLACAGCHELDKGGTDQLPVSKGVGDQLGPINAPTVFNAVFHTKQFWDGRAADLQEQADGPVNNPLEMASNWEEACPKLNADEALKQEFTAVYPEGFSKDTVTNAIATFEKTLITPNCAYDRYLEGDENALNAEAKAGLALFMDFGCAMCHVGKAMGGQSFEKMGRMADYFADRGNITDADHGRFSVTKNEADKFKLKTPGLRNIAITFPYFHDASTDDLGEAVAVMTKYQVGRTVTEKEQAEFVAFLKSLTGELNGRPL